MPAAREARGGKTCAFRGGADVAVGGADKAVDKGTPGEGEGEEARSSALPTTTFHTRLLPPGRLLVTACACWGMRGREGGREERK